MRVEGADLRADDLWTCGYNTDMRVERRHAGRIWTCRKKIFLLKKVYMSKKIKGRTPNFRKIIFSPKIFFLQKRSLKVTKSQKSILYSNERYLQMQSNGDLQKVIQGHPRSRKVKNRYFSENSSASRVRRPESRGGGGGSFRVGGRANFAAASTAYSECEYISVFN